MTSSSSNQAAATFNVSHPCLDCAVSCCQAFRIYVTAFDLSRISQRLGVAPSEFCLPVQCAGDNLDHRHLAFSLGAEEHFLLGLRRRRQGCLFLMRIGHQRRCGIHDVRPLVCRSYPLAPYRQKPVMARQALCPRPWVLNDAQTQAFLRLQEQREREGCLYQAL
ncbi:MAG TPA: YkgJ family cysteine cluster protein, partial [Candidatus Ozemobacteraceae bacterium]|nr:YkgJ family cysteine cluster protein [Candidatus Ozemobacteraceae bacterium]